MEPVGSGDRTEHLELLPTDRWCLLTGAVGRMPSGGILPISVTTVTETDDRNGPNSLSPLCGSFFSMHKVLRRRKHLRAPKYPQYMKHWRDASDMANLLSIAWQKGETIDNGPSKFTESARPWVNEFIATYPRPEISYQYWRSIGFEQ